MFLNQIQSPHKKVLNDLADKRWNGTQVIFSANSLSQIPHERNSRTLSFYHLFSRARFAKQSLMQILSMCTYSIVNMDEDEEEEGEICIFLHNFLNRLEHAFSM
jgi:hypothetical protein